MDVPDLDDALQVAVVVTSALKIVVPVTVALAAVTGELIVAPAAEVNWLISLIFLKPETVPINLAKCCSLPLRPV